MKAALSAQINKTDRNEACGINQVNWIVDAAYPSAVMLVCGWLW